MTFLAVSCWQPNSKRRNLTLVSRVLVHPPCCWHQGGGAIDEEEGTKEEGGEKAQPPHLQNQLVNIVVLGPNASVMLVLLGY